MAKKKAEKKETKSDFLRKALRRNPNLELHQLNQRWAKQGHAGTISGALYYHVRAELGIKTEWVWVQTSEPEFRRPGTTEVDRAGPTASRPGQGTGEVYQLKLTLLGAEPPIWRRIQVRNGTLDMLHESIQTAMGWTNSHLHHFRINNRLYGDPMLMGATVDDLDYADSTATLLSDVVPRSGEPFSFEYMYDFGDSWEHEILFEGRRPAEPKKSYPLCLEGARACPPEDVGGVWGYSDFLEALGDPDHPDHKDMKRWIGGRFDPEAFNPVVATKRMKQGLPGWHRMR